MPQKKPPTQNSVKKRVSIADVALAASVSKATVSLVLNGKSEQQKISGATARRVIEAARKIRYHPRVPKVYGNQMAGLARHISLAFINPSGKSEHEFFSDAFFEIASAAGEEDLMIHTSEGVRPDEMEDYCKNLKTRDTEGVILFTFFYEKEEWLDTIRDSGVPFVVFNRDFGPEYPSVVMDHQGQAYDQAGRLIEAGHKRIACFGPPFGTSLERIQGYRDRLTKAGIYDPALELEISYNVDTAELSNVQDLQIPPDVTALFCTTDYVALGLLRLIKSRGIRVPEELSIVSLDGYDFGRYTEPPLTTIKYPRREMGRAALKLLRQLVTGQTPPAVNLKLRGNFISGGTLASAIQKT